MTAATENLLAKARARRVAALASLENREDNLFAIADYRLQNRAEQRKPMPLFVSTRSAEVVREVIGADVKVAA
ncbi:MAG: hypothetical protein HRU32_13075 [Rhodobacteraceae bacterium]|nr:hypothetical protein [Paracoccaceae bacterium]